MIFMVTMMYKYINTQIYTNNGYIMLLALKCFFALSVTSQNCICKYY